MTETRTWRQAMEVALYGPAGFYRQGRGPGVDYRTASSASPHLATALLRLATEVDLGLGHPDTFELVEVGAASGSLLTAMWDQAAAVAPELSGRLRLHGVDLRSRPAALPAEIDWSDQIPPVTGLLFANEWLDNLPLDVVELTTEGVRLVLVDPAGSESIGPCPAQADTEWLRAWWPLEAGEIGDRAEAGLPRDQAWRAAVDRVRRGVAVAVDYAHERAERVAGGYAGGTLVGYRGGRLVAAAPDGRTDLTAHVAIDSCAAIAAPLAAVTSLSYQRDVLRALGVTGSLPARELATRDPIAYLAALQRTSEEAELIRPEGLGRFRWLSHAIDCPLPAALAAQADQGAARAADMPR